MVIIYALLSGFFAGITSVLSKVSVDKSDTNLITFLRTIIILITSIFIVIIFKSYKNYNDLTYVSILFLIVSGFCTSLMWLCYFKALYYGNINKVTPIEKSSIVLTMILSFIFLREKFNFYKFSSILLIILGTIFMVKKNSELIKNKKWLAYSLLTALFNSLTTIISKFGLKDIDTNFATMLKTFVVFIIIFVVIIYQNKLKEIKYIKCKNIKYIIISGVTTAISWIFYFKALKDGNTGVIFSLEKSSIIVVYILSIIFLKEKINLKQIIGLILIIIGMCLLII